MRWTLSLLSLVTLVGAQTWPARIARMDSLLKAYLAWTREGGETPPVTPSPIEVPPEVYEERLQALQTTIPLELNSVTLQFIRLYLFQESVLTARLLGLADYYFPIIEPILTSYGLPPELKYLTVIESALVPEALSPMAGRRYLAIHPEYSSAVWATRRPHHR
ncbi:MAG: hypothetical protein KatS3mg026_1351 [Bacteroidia bacterium]|nr:MAG: hypothetical protein KatS3mg026_1351 [Bacteroidia bacterium]